jgi:hypothetical protein
MSLYTTSNVNTAVLYHVICRLWGWMDRTIRLNSAKRLDWLHNHSDHKGIRLDGMQNKAEQWQEAELAAVTFWTQWYEAGLDAEQFWTQWYEAGRTEESESEHCNSETAIFPNLTQLFIHLHFCKQFIANLNWYFLSFVIILLTLCSIYT